MAPLNLSGYQKIIDDFLTLSQSSDLEAVIFTEKLRVFHQCNQALTNLDKDSATRQDVNRAALNLLYGKIREREPIELAPSTDDVDTFVRMVDDPNTTAPDYEEILKKLASEANSGVNHPAGVSSLAFAFGSLITLSVSYVDRTDFNVNKVSGFLDLEPLYGFTPDDSEQIRTSDEGLGKLLPDAFFESSERMLYLPRATSVLLILFSRNHNFIARRLLEENENGKWADPSTLEGDLIEDQDEEIFQLARRINCGLFRNIVVNDFLKGLLGYSSHEISPTIDLFTEIKDEELFRTHVSVEFSTLYQLCMCAMISSEDEKYIEDTMIENLDGTPINEIQYDQLQRFLDDFAEYAEPRNGRGDCVGLKRNAGTGRFEDAELANVLQAATEATASTFALSGKWTGINFIERSIMEQARKWEVCSFNEFRKLLGLPAYKSFEDWAINADIANAAKELYEDIDELELCVGLRGEELLTGGFGLGKTMTQGLIVDIIRVIRSDPDFSSDFTREKLTNWGYEELAPPSTERPVSSISKLFLRHLPNNNKYNNVYTLFPFTTPVKNKENLLGNFGISVIDYEFDKPLSRHVAVLQKLDSICTALDEPEKYETPYGEDLRRITGGYGYMLGFDDKEAHDGDEWLTLKSLFPDAGTMNRYATFYGSTARNLIRNKSKRIDQYTCKIDLIQDVINSVSAAWAAEKICDIPLNSPKGLSDAEFYQMLLDINNCIFGNFEPQEGLALLSKATKAGQTIMEYIERSLGYAIADPEENGVTSHVTSLLNELFLEKEPQYKGSTDILARFAASGRDTKELSANALGLAVMSSVNYAQTCATAVKFYLSKEQEKERAILVDLATKEFKTEAEKLAINETIMGYIRESQRLNPQVPVVHRNVAVDHVIKIDGYDVELKKGDRLSVDFKSAHAGAKDIDPTRQTRFLHGAGFHKCPGIAFTEKTMPEVFKAIFRLEDIRCDTSKKGTSSLVITYKKQKKFIPDSKGTKSRSDLPFIQRVCDAILVLLAVTFTLYLSAWAVSGFFSVFRNGKCISPKHLRPWEVYTMFPGPDNKTVPFIYTVQHPQSRRISFIDIDDRDMQFKVFVDGKLKKVSTDFELDKSINCGRDVNKCIDQSFSQGSVIIPSGKHTLKVEWNGKDFLPGTNTINWGDDRSRRFMWKQESC